MQLKLNRDDWERLAKEDPLWAILACKSKRGGKWDIKEFFETGRRRIAGVMNYLDSLDIEVSRDKALDFGCGIGRLTQALADYFNVVYGVDIAYSMIRLAKKYNKYGNKCRYYLNDKNNLHMFKNNFFNFIYSDLTLQHIPPVHSMNYIKEFMRTLDFNGVLVFQLFDAPPWVVRIFKPIIRYRKKIARKPVVEMYGIKKEKVIELIENCGGNAVQVKQNKWRYNWMSLNYFIVK